jgi:uncharacterized protein YjiS (DUF1127 family)
MGPVARFFSIIGNAMVSIGEANSKVRQVDALNALSDEELAARGIKRQDIVRHVFSYWV